MQHKTIGQIYERQRCVHPEQSDGVFLSGSELEIEGLQAVDSRQLVNNLRIDIHEDGSLRSVNGQAYEFILPPETINNSTSLFRKFHEDGYVKLSKDSFSERTSIHTHVNMLDSYEYQAKNLIYLYSIFEPLFFLFVGKARQNNIHCVPLSYTLMPGYYKENIMQLTKRWTKYAALNLTRLRDLGTFEFRHMYGHNNVVVFEQWLLLLKSLWDAAHTFKAIDSEFLLNIKPLQELRESIITDQFIQCSAQDPRMYRVEDNLLDVKLAFA